MWRRDWLRGALSTVDRSFGIFNYFHHHIADTHVAHHLFSQARRCCTAPAAQPLATLGDNAVSSQALQPVEKHCTSERPSQ